MVSTEGQKNLKISSKFFCYHWQQRTISTTIKKRLFHVIASCPRWKFRKTNWPAFYSFETNAINKDKKRYLFVGGTSNSVLLQIWRERKPYEQLCKALIQLFINNWRRNLKNWKEKFNENGNSSWPPGFLFAIYAKFLKHNSRLINGNDCQSFTLTCFKR